MRTSLAPVDVIEKATDLIETVGWTQGNYTKLDDETGVIIGYCALGACTTAASILAVSVELAPGLHTRLLNATFAALQQAVARESIMAWNDRPGQTREEVVEKLRHVAKDLRNNATPGDAS
jgi:hypothetical protein